MAKYTRKEFADLCHKDQNWLRVYISNGKVKEVDGHIDDSVLENDYFLRKWSSKAPKLPKQKPISEPVPVYELSANMLQDEPQGTEKPQNKPRGKKNQPPDVIPEKPPKSKSKPAEGSYQIPFNDNGAAQKWDLDMDKKQLEIKQAEMKLRLDQIKLDKSTGEVIPVAIVKTIFSTYGKNITTYFHDAAEAFLIEISKIKSLSAAETATMRGKLTKNINDAVDRAVGESTKNIKNIVKDYSNQRGVGEHD